MLSNTSSSRVSLLGSTQTSDPTRPSSRDTGSHTHHVTHRSLTTIIAAVITAAFMVGLGGLLLRAWRRRRNLKRELRPFHGTEGIHHPLAPQISKKRTEATSGVPNSIASGSDDMVDAAEATDVRLLRAHTEVDRMATRMHVMLDAGYQPQELSKS